MLFLTSNCTGVRTAPASNQKMSKESSPALQSKLILASEVEETITPVSQPISLTELTTSLEALNTEVDKRLTVVHHTQTSSSSGANKIPGSPDMRDQKKTLPAPIHWPKRYALEMGLEVEVGPRLFVSPEDDSYSYRLSLNSTGHHKFCMSCRKSKLLIIDYFRIYKRN